MRNARGTFYVTVYATEERYGGPEEGGWWYESGIPVKHIRVRGFEKAMNVAEEFNSKQSDEPREILNGSFDYEISGPNDCDGSEIFGSRLTAYVAGKRPGKAYPERRPHYE